MNNKFKEITDILVVVIFLISFIGVIVWTATSTSPVAESVTQNVRCTMDEGRINELISQWHEDFTNYEGEVEP